MTSASEIEASIRKKDWARAEKELARELSEAPKSHWLLTRMAAVLYEQHRFREALTWNRRALRQASSCPLVLWDHAGTLGALGRWEEARGVLLQLRKIGLRGRTQDPCYEGPRWASALLNDVLYRLGIAAWNLGNARSAAINLHRHLAGRARNTSIYTKRHVLERLKAIEAERSEAGGDERRRSKDRIVFRGRS